MANITLTLPDEVIRDAKVLAAQRDTSVSGLVLELLRPAVGNPESYEEVWRREKEKMRRGILRTDGKLPSREELHER